MEHWRFLNNTFLTVTQDSYRSCKKIGDVTLNALIEAANGGAEPFAGLQAGLEPH